MFSIIADEYNIERIKEAVHARGDIVLYSDCSDAHNVIYDLDTACELASKYIIIDFFLVSDAEILIDKLKQVKLSRPRMQFIIYAVDTDFNNRVLASLIKSNIVKVCFVSSEMPQDEINELLNLTILNPISDELVNNINIGKKKFFEDIEEVKTTQKDIRDTYIEPSVIFKPTLVGTISIAVAGTMHRVGTTHYSLLIANFLKSKGFKVAIVEFNSSNSFKKIFESYVLEKFNDGSFLINNIHFFPNALDVSSILSYDFEYIIYDMGRYYECNLLEFQRTTKQIIVSGSKEWELSELEHILKNDNFKNRYKYLFNLSGDKEFEFISQNMEGLNIFKGIYTPSTFQNLDMQSSYFIQSLITELLPEDYKDKTKINKKIRFFNNLMGKGKKQ